MEIIFDVAKFRIYLIWHRYDDVTLTGPPLVTPNAPQLLELLEVDGRFSGLVYSCWIIC